MRDLSPAGRATAGNPFSCSLAGLSGCDTARATVSRMIYDWHYASLDALGMAAVSSDHFG